MDHLAELINNVESSLPARMKAVPSLSPIALREPLARTTSWWSFRLD